MRRADRLRLLPYRCPELSAAQAPTVATSIDCLQVMPISTSPMVWCWRQSSDMRTTLERWIYCRGCFLVAVWWASIANRWCGVWVQSTALPNNSRTRKSADYADYTDQKSERNHWSYI